MRGGGADQGLRGGNSGTWGQRLSMGAWGVQGPSANSNMVHTQPASSEPRQTTDPPGRARGGPRGAHTSGAQEQATWQ